MANVDHLKNIGGCTKEAYRLLEFCANGLILTFVPSLNDKDMMARYVHACREYANACVVVDRLMACIGALVDCCDD